MELDLFSKLSSHQLDELEGEAEGPFLLGRPGAPAASCHLRATVTHEHRLAGQS